MSAEYILGINGLGISPSACVIKNGEIIAMAEEERFNRVKNSFGVMPGQAVAYCLKEAGISLSDINKVAFAWDSNFYKWRYWWFLIIQFFKRFFELKTSSSNISRVFHEYKKYHPKEVKRQIQEMLNEQGLNGKVPPIKFVSHHLSHAASTFYASSFREATILVIDGSGENISTSIWSGKDKQLIEREKYLIPDSLGWFYQTITEYLGFTPNSHEGKVMALAAYGQHNQDVENKLRKVLQILPNGKYRFNSIYSFGGQKKQSSVFSIELEKLLGSPRKKDETLTQYHKDIAFHTQALLEEVVIHLINKTSKKDWFSNNICIAGGVGLNCKMNGTIAQLDFVKNIYVPPFSSDIGTAFGAAIQLSSQKGKAIHHAYWGPEFDDAEIKSVLEKHHIAYVKVDDIAEKTADLLVENKIIGWFQGRMEIGSRALGARSIIANPSIQENRDFINQHVKNREFWRPFAASILDEKKQEYIDTQIDAPFMAIAFKVKSEAENLIPAAIHIDDTTRPQFVTKEAHPLYWETIKRFGDKTGVYAVLNTSFNGKEEPIVCTPDHAIRTFSISGLDALIIGNFLITKMK